MNPVKRIVGFIKQEMMLCVSFGLALASVIYVPVDRRYLDYIDFHTLIILFCLMTVMAGLRELSVFAWVGRRMLNRTRSTRSIVLVLVLLCFAFSMVITNDVALITFVPFTIEVLAMAGLERYLIRVIVLQTIASNLGSMLTPIGNPQNLYLYSLGGMTPGSFMALMLPLTLLSLAAVVLACILLTGKPSLVAGACSGEKIEIGDNRKMAVYLLLFLLALTGVARLLPGYIVLAVILVVVLVMDLRILRKVDYSLLLTFIFLFVLIGNLKRIPAIHAWLQSAIQGNELLTSVLASQFISNVPAAILLSGFTKNIPVLIVGTNLGGLGTIIASMASLISFKYYTAVKGHKSGAFLGVFTLLNLIFLAVLLLFYYGTTAL